jgi:Aspartyl/Asparaginyl beta-hydroxylase
VSFGRVVIEPLPPHEEHIPFRTATGTIGARGRLHIPILTNDDAELVIDGNVVHLPVGGVYLVNQGCVHPGTQRRRCERVHLVVDLLLTQHVLDVLCGLAEPPAPLLRTHAAEVPARRTEPAIGHRRLPPQVAVDEAAELMPCLPQ